MTEISIVNQQILHKKIQYLYQDFHVRFAAFTATSLVMAYISSKEIDKEYIVYWLLIGTLVFFIRASSHFLYRSHKDNAEAASFWGKVFFYNAAITGIYFGLSSFVIYISQSETYSITIGALVFAYTISVMNSSVSYMSAFYVFMIFAFLPFSIVSFFSGSYYLTISISIINALFFIIFLMISRGNGKVYNELLKLRFELEQEKESAEKANKEKSRVLAAASHDLRQPLNTLSLSAGLLDNRNLDKNSRSIVDVIKKSIDVMDNMFGALLDISKLDAGIIIPVNQHFHLSNVLKIIVNDNESFAIKKNIKISYSGAEYVVITDPILLESIIRNIVSNAIRYTEKGCVSISCSCIDNYINLKIVDTGIGIDLLEQKNIFKEYYQVSNPERDRIKGFGLGLSIVENLLSLLNIDMQLKSTLGVGTEFLLSIPLGKESAIIKDERHYKLNKLKNVRVVVIDDDKDICQSMESLLVEWGCNVLTGESASEILEKSKQEPMVIIADYRLRENVTGGQAIKELYKSYNKNIPAIIITGDTGSDRLQEAKKEGYLLLHKPVSVPKLRASIQAVLR